MADITGYKANENAAGNSIPHNYHDNGDGTYAEQVYTTGGTGSSAPQVQGNAAHDAVDSGNPVKIGGKASTSLPTAVSNLDRVDAYFNEYGEQETLAGGHTSRPELLFKTSGGDVVIPSTPSAYTVGNVIGTNFTVSGVGRVNGGTGILYAAAFLEILGASAYNAQAVTATNASPCVVTLNAHTLVNGNRVKLGGTAVPTGFTAGTSYYVVNAAANTFQLSATPGGTAINSTSTGTSVTVTEVPAQAAVTLWLTTVAPTAATDNSIPAPSATDFEAFKNPIFFSSYNTLGLHAASGTSIGQGFKCAAGATSLFGYLLFNGTANQTFSKQAYLKLRIFALQD
jgi:hypothetical protein